MIRSGSRFSNLGAMHLTSNELKSRFEHLSISKRNKYLGLVGQKCPVCPHSPFPTTHPHPGSATVCDKKYEYTLVGVTIGRTHQLLRLRSSAPRGGA